MWLFETRAPTNDLIITRVSYMEGLWLKRLVKYTEKARVAS